MNHWRSVIAAVAAMPLLAACDPVTYGRVVIASEDRIDTACLTEVEEQLRAEGGIEVRGSIAGTMAVAVRRGSDDIGFVLESSTPTRITLSFTWLGRSPAADERGEFQLLDEVQAMQQSPLLEFRSTIFEVVEGEDEQTNPGIYGKSLAAWLASQLHVPEEDVIAEDFGWCVPVKSSQHRVYVACSSEDDSKDRWRVFVFAEGGFVSRLLGRDTRAAEITSAFARIKQILEANSGISAITERRA